MTLGVDPARAVGRPRGHVDAAILQAALDLLTDLGYDGMSMEAVAAAAGVAKTTVYRRWPTKDDLVLDALSRVKGEATVPPAGTVREQLLFMLARMRDAWGDRRHARLMQQLTADGIARPERYREIRARVMLPRRNALRDCLQRGVDAGEIDPDADLNWAVDLLVAPVIAAGLTHQRRMATKQIEFIVDTILRGIAPA